MTLLYNKGIELPYMSDDCGLTTSTAKEAPTNPTSF